MWLESNSPVQYENSDSQADLLLSPNLHVPKELSEWIETEKKYNEKSVRIDTWAEMNNLWIDVSWINNQLWQNIENNNKVNKKLLNWKKWDVPVEIYTKFNNNIKNIESGSIEDKKIIQEQLLDNVGDIFKSTPSKKDSLPVYVKISWGYEKAYIKNEHKVSWKYFDAENFSLDVYQSRYMQELDDILKEWDWTMKSIIDWMNNRWYNEVDLLKMMWALTIDTTISLYDKNFVENWDYDYAKKILWQKMGWDEMIWLLKWVHETWERIDSLTCMIYSTVIAKILEIQWYETVQTATINTWVQHRFTTLKWKDNMTHIISLWQIYSWENFDQAYINYQWDLKSITLQSDMFDSDNNHLGSYQTETMKYLWNIVSANWSLNSQNLAKDISENWIDNKNRLDIEIWNTFKRLWVVSINENGNWYNLSASQKSFANDWTTVTSAKIWWMHIFDTWKNSNFKIAEQLSVSQTKFKNWNTVENVWMSLEMTGFKWFNQNVNGDAINNGIHANVSWSVGANVLGDLDSSKIVPITDVMLTWSIASTVWYKADKLNVYLNTATSWQIQNISSTANTWDGKIKIDWYSIWAWWEYYIDWIWTISAKADYEKYRWNNTTTVWWWIENDNFQITAEHEKTDYDFKIAQKRESNKANIWYKIWDTNIPFTDRRLEGWIISTNYEQKNIWLNKISDTWTVNLSFKF